MRIGIITQPLRYNYGGLLQNFALQTVLTRLGHDVITLDGEVKVRKTGKYYLFKLLKKTFSLFLDSKRRFLHIWKYEFTSDVLSRNTRRFIEKHIKVKRIGHPNESEYDALIVGSDQVWRPMYSNLEEAFLSFAKKWKSIKRIAYAASFGSDEWEYSEEETQYCKKLIQLFDAVSVREKSGVKLCKDYLGVKAIHVIDPTLLLSKDDYVKLLKLDSIEKSDGSLFYYFLDSTNQKLNIVSKVEKELDLKAFTVNSNVEDSSAPLDKRIQPPVEEWLRAFIDASFVVTDSFHGCVFSIIFNKPFVVISNKKRGNSRFESLLEITTQTFRMINSINEITLIDDYNKLPNANLEIWRKNAMTFIKNSLTRSNRDEQD